MLVSITAIENVVSCHFANVNLLWSTLTVYHNVSFQMNSVVPCITHRYECYKCVTDILDELVILSQAHPTSPVIPTHPGPPLQADPNKLSSQEAEAYVSIAHCTLFIVCHHNQTPWATALG